MLTESGRVVAVENDGLWVETLKESACSQCQAKNGCGQKLLASASANFSHVKAVFTDLSQQETDWQIGEEVDIGVEESAIVKWALIAYLTPLIFLLIFTVVGAQMALKEGMVMALAALGLLFGGVIVRIYNQRLKREPSAQVVVVSRSQPVKFV